MISYNAVYAAKTVSRYFFLETGLSQTEVPRRLSIVRLLMVLSSVCFFLIAKINQIPETCISQISGILSYFAGFYPFVLEGLNAARLRS